MKKITSFVFVFFIICVLTLFAQIPNAGFENWTGNEPNGWDNLNSITSAVGIYTCTKGTPGNPGNSYIKLESKNIPFIGIVPGVALCGSINKTNFTPKSGFPYNQRPLALSGSWQYQASGADQGFVFIAFTRWNTVNNKRDTIGLNGFNLQGSVTSWTNFNLPISFNTPDYPDTCIIALSASGQTPVAGSYLDVDNLNFEFTIGVNDINANNSIRLFPNPAKDKLYIKIDEFTANTLIQYKIFNNLGQLVLTSTTTSLENEIDITKLPKGFYQLLIIANKNQYITKFIKE
jgi:hypothetical protein